MLDMFSSSTYVIEKHSTERCSSPKRGHTEYGRVLVTVHVRCKIIPAINIPREFDVLRT